MKFLGLVPAIFVQGTPLQALVYMTASLLKLFFRYPIYTEM